MDLPAGKLNGSVGLGKQRASGSAERVVEKNVPYTTENITATIATAIVISISVNPFFRTLYGTVILRTFVLFP